MVASRRPATPKHPAWYFNVKANPAVTLQDGNKLMTLTAREIDGVEREYWWEARRRGLSVLRGIPNQDVAANPSCS